MSRVLGGAVSLGAMLVACASGAAVIRVPADQPTIQAGLLATTHGDTVLVACGTYYEHDIVMQPGVTLRSTTADPQCVIIDAQQQGRVVFCDDLGSSGVFQGLTFMNGLATGAPPDDEGGGVYCSSSSPVFRDCIFDGNHAQHAFAGIGRASSDGGGLSCLDGSSPELIDCIFRQNTAWSSGAAVAIGHGSSSPSFIRCVFEGNEAGNTGGAIWCWGGELTLSDCRFAGNSASGGDGGALELLYYNTTVVEDCVFSGNSAGGAGGAILTNSYCSVSIRGCIFYGNTAANGGAIHCSDPTPLEIQRSSFCSNSATYGGGTLFVASGSPTIEQSIVALGESQTGAFSCHAGTTISLSCCDVFGNIPGDWIGCVADQLGVNDNICADPMFCDWQSQDLTLDEASPCAPDNSPCGLLIGAYGVACGASTMQEASWGSIKAGYR